MFRFFLSVNAAKWLIAEAISRRPEVQTALENGTLILKGGTTTSCLSAILTGSHLRLCGRVTCRGAVANLKELQSTYGTSQPAGHTVPGWLGERCLLKFGPECVLVTGANLIDCSGGAALLAGSPGGGSYGAALSAIETEGIRVLIAKRDRKTNVRKYLISSSVVSKKTCLSLPWDGLRTASISWRSDYGVGCHLYAGACEISPDWKRRHSRSGRRFSLIQVWGRTEM